MRLEHLGYAITGHRAQGITVDRAHTVVTARTTHETITVEQERWSSVGQLAAEYETIAQAGQHDRWATLLETSGLTEDQVDMVLGSDAYGALSAELRRAEANHHDLDALMPRLVRARGFDHADDIASVLHYRVAHATARPVGSGRTRQAPRLIAGLIPYPSGGSDPEMHHALTERQELIERRAAAVLDRGLGESEPWTTALGKPPTEATTDRTVRRDRQLEGRGKVRTLSRYLHKRKAPHQGKHPVRGLGHFVSGSCTPRLPPPFRRCRSCIPTPVRWKTPISHESSL